MRAPSSPARRRGLAAVLVLGVLAAGGCSADEPESAAPSDPASESQAPARPALRTDAALGVVSGRLDKQARPRLTRKVKAVVDDWLDAAYVGGDYPRTDFDGAFPHFSSGARREAVRDAGLMSNAEIGDRIDSVRATKRRLRVDVLAVDRRAVGLTARFVLEMRLRGEVQRKERVAGSLFLSFRSGEWKVFGYDVNRGKA